MDYYEEEDCSQDTGSDWSVGEEEEMTVAVAATVDGRKSYKVMTEEVIAHLQENDINTVSGVLAVPRGVAAALLCRNNWSIASAYDHWFAAAGEGNPAPVPRDSVRRNCNICFEKIDIGESVSACGHPFCAGCLRSYIAAAVSGGGGCLTLDCPEPGCGAAVTSDLVEKLVSAADLSRYNQYLLRSYVESSRNRKWCPSPGCDRAVELDEVGIGSYDVVCDCSFEFCWGCTGEPHTPLSCAAAAEWCESASWILANTKPCPSCRRPIEKSDDGCNHMVCVAPCRFQFCWNCSNEWLHHHSLCSHCLFRREWSKKEIEEEKPKPERFAGGNCYERWDFNKISRANAVEALAKARSKYAGEAGGGMEFVVEAWEQIVEGWRVLIWSYVYVYGLPEVVTKRAVLEHFQGVATQALDRLQCCVEVSDKRVRLDTPEYWQFRREAKELAKLAANYFESLVLLMTDKVESYALNWEKEALELKNEIAIAESYANDMEVEDLEARDAAIVACYAHDLEEMEMEVDLITKSVPAKETEEDIFFDSKNAEVGAAPLDWNRRFAEFEIPAFDSKDGIAETGSSVFEREKEVPNVKNNVAQSVSYLDSEQEAKEAIELKNDLAEAEGEVKEGIDTKSDSSESDQSYVFVSDKDKESDLDESYVFLSDEERHT